MHLCSSSTALAARDRLGTWNATISSWSFATLRLTDRLFLSWFIIVRVLQHATILFIIIIFFLFFLSVFTFIVIIIIFVCLLSVDLIAIDKATRMVITLSNDIIVVAPDLLVLRNSSHDCLLVLI